MDLKTDLQTATIAFSALSQPTRLKVFKLLIEYAPTGSPAGVLSDQLNIPHNTLSFHLSCLHKAGLISFEKQGRQVIYRAHINQIESLITYLKENCCASNQENCSSNQC